jgi:hypothetical protein
MSGFIGADIGAPTIFNYFKNIGNDVKGGSVDKSFPFSGIRWPWRIR